MVYKSSVITVLALLAAISGLTAQTELLYENFSADEDPPSGWSSSVSGDHLFMGKDPWPYDYCDLTYEGYGSDDGWVREDCHNGDWMQGVRVRAYSGLFEEEEAEGALNTPWIDCSSYDKVELKFLHTFGFGSSDGTGSAESYGKLKVLTLDPFDPLSLEVHLLHTIEADDASDWCSYIQDISLYAAHSPLVKIQWEVYVYADEGFTNYGAAIGEAGWYIDDVRITGYYAHPDNVIENIGLGIMNLDGTGQTVERVVDPGNTTVYAVEIRNADLYPTEFIITGPGSSGHWTVEYFDKTFQIDRTSEVTGSGWITFPPMILYEIDITVIASQSAPPFDACDVLLTTSNVSGINKDAVLARTVVKEYRPDNWVKIWDGDYVGDNIYNTDGAGQSAECAVACNETALYHIKIENDSRNMQESFTVTGTGNGTSGDGTYEVRYFDAPSGGNDITAQVTGAGWTTMYLNTNESTEMRAEVTPMGTVLPNSEWEILIRSTSSGDGSKVDVVLARTVLEDYDCDEVSDGEDNCPMIPNTYQEDSDGDTSGDACDNCPAVENEDQADRDGDTIGDVCDNCPDDANETQDNSDGDTHGDVCDNCPDHDNQDQVDDDGDGVGAQCDCDDGDPNNSPGNTEVCDGQDNDCDGMIDQNDPDMAGSPDFDVSASPDVASVVWFGEILGTAIYDVTVSSVDCYTSTVSLSVTGLPPGTRRYYFDPDNVVTVPARGSVTVMLVIQVTRGTPAGDYILTITGDDGSTTHTYDVTMEVRRPPRGGLVAKAGVGVPEEFVLAQNFPNPFNPETSIEFGLPEDTKVRLRVYNMLGQVVGDLVDENLDAGYYSISWDANELPAGVYFYRIETDNYTKTKRMVYMK